MTMLVLSFLSWWYGSGWKQMAASWRPRLRGVLNSFSVNQLIRTLFAPWRRIISPPGTNLEDRARAWGDNLVSRCIGFSVRLVVLLAALVSWLVVAVLTIIELIAWPLLPLAVPGCIIVGLAL